MRALNGVSQFVLICASTPEAVRAIVREPGRPYFTYGLLALLCVLFACEQIFRLDPTTDRDFWIFGEYAREYNDPAGGHPLGTGGSRWSTWIGSSQKRLC